MGKITAILSIWIVGFTFGFIAYLVYPALGAYIGSIIPFLLMLNIDGQILGAMLAGIASSIVTVIAVFAWAKLSRPKSAF